MKELKNTIGLKNQHTLPKKTSMGSKIIHTLTLVTALAISGCIGINADIQKPAKKNKPSANEKSKPNKKDEDRNRDHEVIKEDEYTNEAAEEQIENWQIELETYRRLIRITKRHIESLENTLGRAESTLEEAEDRASRAYTQAIQLQEILEDGVELEVRLDTEKRLRNITEVQIPRVQALKRENEEQRRAAAEALETAHRRLHEEEVRLAALQERMGVK
jgi:hypothetical protein